MTEFSKYNLEERTLNFSKNDINFCKKLSKDLVNIEIIKQLIRSAMSIGANYIEANESLSKKDFYMRLKICRKEAKETIYWLNLIDALDFHKAKDALKDEATQLMKIFGAIITKEN